MKIISPNHVPLSDEELGVKLAKITAESAPEKIRTAFSRGLAPGFDPAQLFTGLYQLAVKYDELGDNIEQTLTGLPESIFTSAISGDLHPLVIDFIAYYPFGKKYHEVILSNKSTSDDTYARIAKTCNEKLANIIADNQHRLIRFPQIIENLYLNRATPMSTATRIIELAARNNLELSLEAYDEMKKALDLDPPEEEDPIDAALRAEELDQQFKNAEQILIDTSDEVSDEEVEQELKKKGVILSQLPVSARIRLAQLGTKFHRSQLIRDANKVVSMAVIKSPAITDAEVEEYSKNRQISEEIIRYICRRKDWLKSYRVKINLANNPKTPVPTALLLLNSLRATDLKSIARSRNIAQVVRQAASNKLRSSDKK